MVEPSEHDLIDTIVDESSGFHGVGHRALMQVIPRTVALKEDTKACKLEVESQE